MRDVVALLLVGAFAGLLYYVYAFYWNYVLYAALGGLALFALLVVWKLFRRYGRLIFGGVPYAMTGQNIVDYANKYFKDGLLTHSTAIKYHAPESKENKYWENMQKHLELIRDAMFNPSNPAYSPMVSIGQLPMPVRRALMPDLLGFYGKTFRYRMDIGWSGDRSADSDASIWYYESIGQAPVLDNWHRRRRDIYGLMGEPVRYCLSNEGTGVFVFPMGHNWTSPYDAELEEEGFAVRDGEYERWPNLKDRLGHVKEVFSDPPVEEFIAPPAKLSFREVPADKGGHLWQGHLFLGTNIRDGKPYWKPIDTFQHHLVVGMSGYGKSVFLNQVLQGIRFNIARYEAVYLVDLKGGVELVEYEDYGEEFKVIYRYEDLPDIVQSLVSMMEDRLEQMRLARVRNWQGKRILFVIDEYAQIALQGAETKEDKTRHMRLLANLNKLSMLGRATGLNLWVQLQKSTTDVMDSSFKNNLQGQVCFRVTSRLAAAGLFGETKDLEIDPTRLRRGQCIYYDDATGETVYLQAHMRQELGSAA